MSNITNIMYQGQTISSLEVAEMVGKAHNKLMRDIRDYIEQLS